MIPLRTAVGLGVCLLLVTAPASAGPIETSSSSRAWTSACASWSEYGTSEYAYIYTCAYESRYEGTIYRFVEATRTVGTCSEWDCEDTYREEYTGQAQAEEVSIDPAEGRASIDIVLPGELPGDACPVRLEMDTDPEADDSNDVWPTFEGGLRPEYFWTSIRSGDRTIGASGQGVRDLELRVRSESDAQSYGRAVGNVCDWSLASSAPGWASISTETDAMDTVDVTLPYASTEVGGQRRAGAFWTTSTEGGSLHVYALLRQYSGSAYASSGLEHWAEPRAVDVYVSTWLCRGEGDNQTCEYRDLRAQPGNDPVLLDPMWSSVQHETVLTDEDGASCSFRLTWEATEPAEVYPTTGYGDIEPDRVSIERAGASVERDALATIASPCLPDDLSLLDGFLIQEHSVSAFAIP